MRKYTATETLKREINIVKKTLVFLADSTNNGNAYHLTIDFKLGWLTVLSSRKIVEQELHFFESFGL